MISKPTFLFNKVLIIFPMDGDKLCFQNDNLVVKDKNNKIKFQYTCYKIILIYIVGGMTITTSLLEKSKKFGFSIAFMTTSFRIYHSINYETKGNFILRGKQYNCNISNKIANRIIYNKILNQIVTLEKLRNKDLRLPINIIKDNLNKLDNLDLSISEIMGIEGICAKVYFNNLFKNISWKKREPRLKRDIPNLLLDVGYTVLFNYIEALLNLYGFDIYKANLHQEFYKRKSLVCDIIEPFRSIIDYKILKMYNLKQINEEDFILMKNAYQLNYKSSKKITLEFLNEINLYKESIFIYIQKYYRWFMKSQDIEKIPFGELRKNDTN